MYEPFLFFFPNSRLSVEKPFRTTLLILATFYFVQTLCAQEILCMCVWMCCSGQPTSAERNERRNNYDEYNNNWRCCEEAPTLFSTDGLAIWSNNELIQYCLLIFLLDDAMDDSRIFCRGEWRVDHRHCLPPHICIYLERSFHRFRFQIVLLDIVWHLIEQYEG